MASALVVIRHAPYGGSLARAGVDTALAAAAFEQAVTLLFLGDGVLNLLPQQDARAVGSRNLERLLASLPLYDIDTVYADAASLARHGIAAETLPDFARSMDAEGVRELLARSDHLLGF